MSDTCHFGHIFEFMEQIGGGVSGDAEDAVRKIRNGKITSLEELREKEGLDVLDITGSPVRTVKVKNAGQGAAFSAILSAADNFDEHMGYSASRVEENIYVSPRSQLHDEFMQRKQQAEQRVNQTMQGFSDLLEEKHLLEHDIRKLRSRAEAFDSQDEALLKGDFVELVDGANAGSQQGGEAALKTLQERNIYPSIVSDFMEMDSVEDLEGDGKLADLPENEKAILKKKFTMYEKWKDLFGSEVNRRLDELKAQLRHVEESIEETKSRIEPYIRDVVMINEMGENQHMQNFHPEWQGYSSMFRDLSFICEKGMKIEDGALYPAEDEEPTHYRIIHVQGLQILLANPENPNQPGGKAVAKIMWRPMIVCKHVRDRFFKPKIEEMENLAQEMVDKHVGSFEPGDKADKYRSAREDKDLSVRELREKVGEQVEDKVPIELSAKIRRIEDGLDDPSSVKDRFDEEIFEALRDVLEIEEEEDEEDEMYGSLKQKIREFTGQTDEYYLSSSELGNAMGDFYAEYRFGFYYDWKIGEGLFTMK